jgi:hypothetical protein
MKEVLVTLAGGLGNQMFQYAVARGIAYRNNCDLKIDYGNHFNPPELPELETRLFGLNHFNISGRTIDRREYPWFFSHSFYYRAWRLLQRKGLLPGKWLIVNEPENKQFCFDPMLFQLRSKANVWLIYGFWQTPKYFADIEPIIRNEFNLVEPLDVKNIEMLTNIRQTNSIGIHIRRGDYVYNQDVAEVLGTLDLNYYYLAIEKIVKVIADPRFYIFSDDPEWVKQNIHLPYPVTLVTHNGKEKDFLDLYLMSQCKHHIIANSSFSWWAAWLGKKTDQIIFAPKNYFRNKGKHTPDLYPETWALL